MTNDPFTISSKPLGQLLLGRGLIRVEQLDRALLEQRRCNHQKLLGEILIDLQDCTEQQVAEALAESYGIPYARISPRLADPQVLSALPRDFIEKQQVLPLFLVDGVLTIAVSEPANVFLLEAIQRHSHYPVQIVAASASDIRATLRAHLPGDHASSYDASLQEVRAEAFRLIPPPRPAATRNPATGTRSASAPSASAAQTPADKLLHFCLYTGLKEGATAVHFEPMPDALRVRFRIDGVLVEKLHPPARLHEPLTLRVKAAAGLDLGQQRVPQHGLLNATVDGKPVHLHASTAPSRCGETIVVRLADAEKSSVNLEKLGFNYDMLKQWRRLLSLPSGLILVTGPADSGKRTTLYSSLETRNITGANLCTVEDPIRHALSGVNQFQVDHAAGLTPAAILEGILRQEPDVLMLTDIPDASTAHLAARAALGGQLVLAGIDAPDAPMSLSRLFSLGLEPYLIASSVAAILSQRLVRKLCQACRETYEPTGVERRKIEKTLPGITTLFRPKGCARCRNLGYSGRVGLFELLVPDDALTDQLGQGATLSDIRRLAKESNMATLRADGLEKAKAGITTVEEIYRVIG